MSQRMTTIKKSTQAKSYHLCLMDRVTRRVEGTVSVYDDLVFFLSREIDRSREASCIFSESSLEHEGWRFSLLCNRIR